MGLLSFVKNAGKKLMGRAEASEGPDEEALKKELDDLGLDASGMDIEVEGDRVKVRGKAADQDTKEKVLIAMGNVEGIAEVDDQVEGAEPRTHTVEKGDTLWAISEATLGDGSRYNEIFEANRPMLSDPDKIYPGQVLRIPAT